MEAEDRIQTLPSTVIRLSVIYISCYAHFLSRDFSFAIQNCMVREYKHTLQEDI